jgi:hypothetical protein
MQVLVDISDEDSVFGMKVLRSLSFINKAEPIDANESDLRIDLKEASDQVRLHKQGKIKLKTAEEVLNEL